MVSENSLIVAVDWVGWRRVHKTNESEYRGTVMVLQITSMRVLTESRAPFRGESLGPGTGGGDGGWRRWGFPGGESGRRL